MQFLHQQGNTRNFQAAEHSQKVTPPRRALLKLTGSLGLLTTLGLVGCEEPKKEAIAPKPLQTSSSEARRPMRALKGIGLTADDAAGRNKLRLLNVEWSYDWGSGYPPQPTGAAFVPMIWSKRDIDARIQEVKDGMAEHRPAALLGFNEPDYTRQANMSVDEAIKAWPALESVNVRLGSPAAALSSGHWLDEFMAKAKEAKLRVDFMTFHSYRNPNPEGFLKEVTALYEAYGKPIWVTEFAVADWNAREGRPSVYTTAQVQEYMHATVDGLRKLPYVERFAWHPNKTSDLVMGPSALFNDDGSLTDVGATYASL